MGQLTFVFPKPLDSFSSLHLLSSCWWACLSPDGFAVVCGTLCSTCGLGSLPVFLSSLPLPSFSVVYNLERQGKADFVGAFDTVLCSVIGIH